MRLVRRELSCTDVDRFAGFLKATLGSEGYARGR